MLLNLHQQIFALVKIFHSGKITWCRKQFLHQHWYNGKWVLTVRQWTNHLVNLKIDVLDNRNITGKHLSRMCLHLNQSGSSLLTKNIISKLQKFWKSLEHLSKLNRSTKPSEARSCINEKEKVSLRTSRWNRSHLKRFP